MRTRGWWTVEPSEIAPAVEAQAVLWIMQAKPSIV